MNNPFPLIILIALLIAGCGAQADPPATSSPLPRVEVTTAATRSQARPVRTSGRLASKAEIPLSFKIDGVIDRILVDEGEAIRAGQRLAQLNLSEIEARVMEATAALEKAERDLARTQRLHRDSVATLEDLEDARTAVDVAAARQQAARFNREYAVIEAPAAGRILRRHAEDGEVVGAGRPVLTLGASSRGWIVRAGVAARDVVRLALGDSAQVRFDAYPNQLVKARVAEIADAADPQTGTFEVELAVDAPRMALKSGFIATIDIQPSAAAEYVEIPAAALVEGDGQDGIVFTLEAQGEAAVQRTPVRIAHMLDSTVVLERGLQPGTTVVTTGAVGLRDGETVRVYSSRLEGSTVEGAQSSTPSR
jgi:RND family efflux transporter MFP subunit